VYSWLRDGLIPGASSTLEALWAYAWISFFLAAGETTSAIRYPFPWVLGLILLPALVGRLVDRSAWGPRWVRQHGLTVLVVGLFVGFMIPFHAAGAAWLVAAALLARGVWLGLHDVGSDSGSGWFIGGFAAFLALLVIGLVAHPASWEPDRAQLGPMMVLYLFAGLSLLALVRRQEMEERAFRRAANEVNGTWLMLLATISATMIGSVALVSFGGSGILRGLVAVAIAVTGLVWRAAMFVVMNWLGPALVWLFSHLALGGGRFDLGSLFGRRRLVNIDARLLAWLRVHLPVEVVVAIVGAMLFVLLAIWLACRFVARDPGADDEKRTSLWSWRLFLRQLRQALRGLRRSLRSQRPLQPAAEPGPALLPNSVRQLYAAALRWCRDRERPRRLGATPLEFEPVLDEEVGSSLARDLTSAYVLARYAEQNLDEADVERLRQRWQARLAEPS